MKINYLEPIADIVKFSPEDILMASNEAAPKRSKGFMETEEIEFD